MNKKIVIFVLMLVLLFSFSVIAFAEENSRNLNENPEPKNNMFVDREDKMDDGLPKVTADDITDWADRKGFEVVGFLQKFAQPFAIIIFIGSAFMSLLGVLGNGQLVSKGLTGMLIALVIYVVVLYAPEIMDVFLNWVRS